MKHNSHKTLSKPENNSPFNQLFYFGIVEDNADPEALGRVRVRVFGIHDENKITTDWKGIPTEDLPWATVLMPSTNGHSGVGRSATGCQPGTQVMLIFRDHDFQSPLVLGTIPNNPSALPLTPDTVGFQDPKGEFPTPEYLNKPSQPSLATGSNTQDTDLSAVAFDSIKSIPKAGPSPDPVKIKIVGGS